MNNRFNNWKHNACHSLFDKRIGRVPSGKTYVCLTFDTEEDWNYDSDQNTNIYFNSYRYISSYAFNELLDGLYDRDISATFYLTLGMAKLGETLKYLVKKKHNIGVHVHPHNFKNTVYPYYTIVDGDRLTDYNLETQKEWMEITKRQIESTIGHPVHLFRSGKLACNNETERAAKLAGFKAISNHSGISYNRYLRLWNLGVGAQDIFDFQTYSDLAKYINLLNSHNESIIIFSAHPMMLYDYKNSCIRQHQLKTFFKFIDYIISRDIAFLNQEQLLYLLE